MFICVGCGSLELTAVARCSKCGSVMKSEDELAHAWVDRPGSGQGIALMCRQRGRTAYMDNEIARELPYCPFCRGDIGRRPGAPQAAATEPKDAIG